MIPDFWQNLLTPKEKDRGSLLEQINQRLITWEELGKRLKESYNIEFLKKPESVLPCYDNETLKNKQIRAVCVAAEEKEYLLSDRLEGLNEGLELLEKKRNLALTSPTVFQRLWEKESKTNLSLNQKPIKTSPRFLFQCLAQIKNLRTTDWHLEVRKEYYESRIRIDGRLRSYECHSLKIGLRLIQEIKSAGKVRLEKLNRAQEGKINLPSLRLNVRFVIIPTLQGEEAILRLLPTDQKLPSLEQLGMPPKIKEKLIQNFYKPGSLLIVNGITGSGKSTTLHSLLNHHLPHQWKALSVEDPIERRLDNITQVEVNNRQGLSFASVARAFLRQSPDVILIGEVRDEETVAALYEACLCGHRVLTTLHANSAQGVLHRLADLGVILSQSELSSIHILSQQLTGIPCPHKSKEEAKNCSRCHGTQIHGRTGKFTYVAK